MHFRTRRTSSVTLNSLAVVGVLMCAFRLASPVSAAGTGAPLPPTDSQVQAIFDRNCIKCHGPLEHKSDLELDSHEGLLRGNSDGPVIVPGKPSKSKLIAALVAGPVPAC